jgi:hypothetical protein
MHFFVDGVYKGSTTSQMSSASKGNVSLSKSQKEAAVAALTELILAQPLGT